MNPELLRTLGAPARRALAAAGIANLRVLSRWTEADVAALHGVGPKAVRLLGEALEAEGWGFRDLAGSHEVDDALAAFDPLPRETLEAVRATLLRVLPWADEGLHRGRPAVLLEGDAIAAYGTVGDRCAYFPISTSVVEAAGAAVENFERVTGGIAFPVGHPLPVGVIRTLVKLRLDDLSAVRSGVRRDHYPDGALKAEGRMRAGELHGPWRWYRQDGALMRVGRFRSGEPVGLWETWDRDGSLLTRAER